MKKLLGNSYGFILGFTPWVLFSIFYTQNKQDMLLACGLAFLSNLILNHKMVYKMFWLPTASTLFF